MCSLLDTQEWRTLVQCILAAHPCLNREPHTKEIDILMADSFLKEYISFSQSPPGGPSNTSHPSITFRFIEITRICSFYSYFKTSQLTAQLPIKNQEWNSQRLLHFFHSPDSWELRLEFESSQTLPGQATCLSERIFMNLLSQEAETLLSKLEIRSMPLCIHSPSVFWSLKR